MNSDGLRNIHKKYSGYSEKLHHTFYVEIKVITFFKNVKYYSSPFSPFIHVRRRSNNCMALQITAGPWWPSDRFFFFNFMIYETQCCFQLKVYSTNSKNKCPREKDYFLFASNVATFVPMLSIIVDMKVGASISNCSIVHFYYGIQLRKYIQLILFMYIK